jgi:glycerate kinase
VTGADHQPVEAAWGLVQDPAGAIAVLEAAQVVGLTLEPAATVADRTSRGLGELLGHCLDAGLRRFMIGVGGSSSNDGGAGLLSALGVRLLDADGKEIAATPTGLARLDHIDFSGLDPRLAECDVTLMSDVQNPLCGPHGATAVFGPQKGVRPEDIAVFDGRLQHFARLCDAWAGRPASLLPGAGAAGGLGYALQLLGARNRAGAELVGELSGLDAALAGADWVLTGEGRTDAQTLLGKAPIVVARHARRAGLPVTLVSGAVEAADLGQISPHFDGCFSITPGPMSLDDSMRQAAALLADRAEQLARRLAGSFS